MYQHEWHGRLLHRRLSGGVDGAEVWHALQSAHADPRYDDVRLVVNDFSACTSLSLQPHFAEEIGALSGAAERSFRRIRFAFVATDAGVIKEIRAYLDAMKAFASYHAELFATVPEALHWLEANDWTPAARR